MLVSKGTTLGNAMRRSLIQHTRWSHSTAALPAPLERVMDLSKTGWGNKEEIEAPHFSYGVGPMVLMAVPKKKVSPYKRGLRNGPKALKPVPVIVRCKSCGRVKLPHFYCCSGDRGSSQGKDSNHSS